ncbi:pseudouridine synthase family protein [Colwellia sp. 12G3]|uniref:pseudouridine synthase family protein n=1 Tax=Colwellia sp. 12G3 TaxID=2058299 RepID=UPI000C33A5E8|nr:RNA pseudouridine synthase [Colwellia sp. 12G3]PKI17044.1 RNA pseudouridine synthase [Colwellia sp. 12G3]
MPVDHNCSDTQGQSQTQSQTQSQEKFEWHIIITEKCVAEQENCTAITLLASYGHGQNISLSKAELKQAISKGALWLTPAKNKQQTQRLRRVKKRLLVGDELHFYFNKEVLSAPVPQAKLIADLTEYSVWYKPYGMLSQGSKWSDHCTIARFAQQNLPNERPAFIVHRLDRAATGLIIVAHSKSAARALSHMFEHHQLEKYYHIIVHGDHNERPQPEVIEKDVDGKSARSTFTCLAYDSATDRSLIRVKIDSGRKHQIRLHAASIGMPVVGDRLHGVAGIDEQCNLQLCAVSLRFICPLAAEITRVSATPLIEEERFFELPETLKPQLSLRL